VRADRSAQLVAHAALSFQLNRDGTSPRDAVEDILRRTRRFDRAARHQVNMLALAELSAHLVHGAPRIHPPQSTEWIIQHILDRTGYEHGPAQ
jgi:hypothetical protein